MKPIRSVARALVASALVVAPLALAQPPSSNPLDAVPEKLPFDVPYGPPISLDQARKAIDAGLAEARKRNWTMAIAVVDSGTNLVAFERMDNTQIASVAVAQHKARTAAEYRRETKAFENAIQLSNFHYVLTLDDVMASRGGIPVVEGGKIVGAVGCSGGTGAQDEVICKAALAGLK